MNGSNQDDSGCQSPETSGIGKLKTSRFPCGVFFTKNEHVFDWFLYFLETCFFFLSLSSPNNQLIIFAYLIEIWRFSGNWLLFLQASSTASNQLHRSPMPFRQTQIASSSSNFCSDDFCFFSVPNCASNTVSFDGSRLFSVCASCGKRKILLFFLCQTHFSRDNGPFYFTSKPKFGISCWLFKGESCLPLFPVFFDFKEQLIFGSNQFSMLGFLLLKNSLQFWNLLQSL